MKILFKNYSLMRSAAAFTLAETLITLGIVGIVAVIALPSLMNNITRNQHVTAVNNFNRKFGEALRIMNIEGVLASQGTTENFVNTLSKYFKVIKTCDSTNLSECFEQKITWTDGSIADISGFTTSNNIIYYSTGESDWGTNIVGVKFLNNVSALIAYNPNCKQNQFNNNLIPILGNKDNIYFGTNNCVAMIYDINSNKKPNRIFNDVQKTDNVRNLKLLGIVNGIKFSKVVNESSLVPIDCTDMNNSDIQYCDGLYYTKEDYWAAAAKACGGKENMASQEDLLKVAQYLYNDNSLNIKILGPGSTLNTYKNVTRDDKKYNELKNYGIVPTKSEKFLIRTNSTFKHKTETGTFENASTYVQFEKNFLSTGYGAANHLTTFPFITICVEK